MKPNTAAETLAQRFYIDQILRELVGREVVILCDIERENFTVPAGATGTVQEPFLDQGMLVACILLDTPPAGSEDYDGELHWIENINLLDFEDEVRLA